MIISDGEKVTFDKGVVHEIVSELCDWFDLDVVTKSTYRNPKETIAELWQEIQILTLISEMSKFEAGSGHEPRTSCAIAHSVTGVAL